MKNLDVLLMALPAVVMFGATIYIRSIHEGISKERALIASCSYGVLAAGFFILAYLFKFASDVSSS